MGRRKKEKGRNKNKLPTVVGYGNPALRATPIVGHVVSQLSYFGFHSTAQQRYFSCSTYYSAPSKAGQLTALLKYGVCIFQFLLG